MKDFIYNMTNYNDTLKSLSKLTGIENIEEYVKENKDDISYEHFCEYYNIDIDKIDISKLYIMGIHVTTNSNNCEDIKKYGLIPNNKVLSIDTELNMYLKSKGIVINIEDRYIERFKNRYILNEEIYKVEDMELQRNLDILKDKLIDFSRVEAFVSTKGINEYSAIRYYPEIIQIISDIYNDIDIINSWKFGEIEAYKVYFKVDVSSIEQFENDDIVYSQEECGDKYIRKFLIEQSLNIIIKSNEQNRMILKDKVFIKKEDINYYEFYR